MSKQKKTTSPPNSELEQLLSLPNLSSTPTVPDLSFAEGVLDSLFQSISYELLSAECDPLSRSFDPDDIPESARDLHRAMFFAYPNIAMDAMAKRWYFDANKYPKLSETDRKTLCAISEDILHRKRQKIKHNTLYQKGLRICYDYITQELRPLPETITEYLNDIPADPIRYLVQFPIITNLYPLLDGGAQQIISKKTISIQTWLCAISLFLAFEQYDGPQIRDIGKNNELPGDIMDRFDLQYNTLVALGIIIHQLELLQLPAITAKLYEIHHDPGKDAKEIRILQKEIESCKAECSASRKKTEHLTQENRQLRKRLEQMPTGIKDTSGIIGRHQQTIRDLNAEIDQLKMLLCKLEEDNADLEHELYLKEAAEQHQKPWMDLKLPETGVLFVGGNPNCVKKWRGKYPKWTFVSTENPNAALPGKVEVIFLCVDHKVSHPLWHRINEIYQNRDRMCYVRATNLDRLNEEMRYEYWKLLNRR